MQSCPRERGFAGKSWNTHVTYLLSCSFKMNEMKDRNLFSGLATGRDGERLVILLGGGTKTRQQDDIRRAQALWSDYRRRKKEEK